MKAANATYDFGNLFAAGRPTVPVTCFIPVEMVEAEFFRICDGVVVSAAPPAHLNRAVHDKWAYMGSCCGTGRKVRAYLEDFGLDSAFLAVFSGGATAIERACTGGFMGKIERRAMEEYYKAMATIDASSCFVDGVSLSHLETTLPRTPGRRFGRPIKVVCRP
jgi:hypothetical protein